MVAVGALAAAAAALRTGVRLAATGPVLLTSGAALGLLGVAAAVGFVP